MKNRPPPRYRPEAAFPAYAYVPGHAPHPVRDPRGHAYGSTGTAAAAVDPSEWRSSPAFLDGIDLFNHGFYWEAHEAWERLWRAYPPQSDAAQLLRGLIRLAAAGVKAHEGRPRGVIRHGRAAAGIFAGLESAQPIFGLAPGELSAAGRRLAEGGAGGPGLDLVLSPR